MDLVQGLLEGNSFNVRGQVTLKQPTRARAVENMLKDILVTFEVCRQILLLPEQLLSWTAVWLMQTSSFFSICSEK